jgi:thioredoxin reductase
MIEVAIVGAGPYGLSIAAHLRGQGVPFRIFGRPMDSWLRHMPKGMSLKSDGFASSLSDPQGCFPLRKFCSDRGIEYSDVGIPVRLDTFTSYGLAFRENLVPELEEKLVSGIERIEEGFQVTLDNGEELKARRVILAIGITHYEYLPEILSKVPAEYASHSFRHSDVSQFRGKTVVVVGGGSSATDLAADLFEAGARVELVARRQSLNFHSGPPKAGGTRSLWKRIRHPQSGLGPSLRSAFFCKAPNLFRYLPASLRTEIVKRHLGPSGTWHTRTRVEGKVAVKLGSTIEKVEVTDGKACVTIRQNDGTGTQIVAHHVIAATGYRVNLERLRFLSSDIQAAIKCVDRTPILSSSFESSVPNLYFVGVSAANSFGPLMRFAYGADFTARQITRRLATVLARCGDMIATQNVVSTTK